MRKNGYSKCLHRGNKEHKRGRIAHTPTNRPQPSNSHIASPTLSPQELHLLNLRRAETSDSLATLIAERQREVVDKERDMLRYDVVVHLLSMRLDERTRMVGMRKGLGDTLSKQRLELLGYVAWHIARHDNST